MTMFPFLVLLLEMSPNEPKEPLASNGYSVHPIGRVRLINGKTTIVLEKKYQDGLLGLDEFSHVYVLYWFDRNESAEKRSILQVHPRGDRSNPLTGVFATRAPVRPNLIALSLCRVISINGNVIETDGIDAYDDTPVIDLKPYLPNSEPTDASFPAWIEHP
jgi:tRNA-Thr(GGU) m(6)t(6)A37 methyltransferase TsaA